jgi:hypothetical protein
MYFLRRIRRSLINTGATRKYLLYAVGEILLVMIGILLALQVNNWNEERKERELEIEILSEIRLNIQKDFEDHFQNIYTLKGTIKSSTIILGTLNNNLPYHDTLNQHFMWMLMLPDFNAITSGFDRLKEGTIANESLRMNISYLYGNTHDWITRRTDQIREFSLQPLHNQIVPYLRNFDFQSIFVSQDEEDASNARYGASAEPKNYKLLQSDDKLKSLIDSHIATLNFHFAAYTRRIELGNKIIQQIDEFIGTN